MGYDFWHNMSKYTLRGTRHQTVALEIINLPQLYTSQTVLNVLKGWSV